MLCSQESFPVKVCLEMLPGLCHRLFHTLCLIQVHLQSQNLRRILFFKFLQSLYVPGGHRRLLSSFQYCLGDPFSQAAGTACDQPDTHISFLQSEILGVFPLY